jgi:hypothetical protein
LKAGRRTATGAWQIAAELLQEQGELAEALTWLTMATERFTEDELDVLGSDAGWASQPGMLVRNRRKIRAEIGLPPDETDLLVPGRAEAMARRDRRRYRRAGVLPGLEAKLGTLATEGAHNQPCWCGAAVKYKKCCGRIA